jgi:NTE family protein
MASAETPVSARTDSAGSPEKKKFGLVLQGGGALGAYEAGAIECLYERDMECAIVAGASSGAVNAVTLAAAKTYPPDVLKAMWTEFGTPKLPVPDPIEHYWALSGVPHMYRPRLDYWNFPAWTYVAENKPLKETLERLDWDQVRDWEHMRLFVSASDVENGKTTYFSNLPPEKLPRRPEYPAVLFAVEHVLASGSFPGGFPWTVIGDRFYWDGGLTDNTPLHPVIDNLTKAEAGTMPIYVIDVNTGYEPAKPANLLEVELRGFEMLLQNNLENDTHRAGSYGRFISLLKEVDRILEKVKKLPPQGQPPELAGLLADLLRVKDKKDWRDAMKYDYVRNIHAVDMKKPPGETPFDFAPESIKRRLREGREQMCEYLDSTPPPAAPGSAATSPPGNTPASSSPTTPD